MLFNSITFLIFFLPVALLIYFLFGRFWTNAAKVWLVVASFIFYGWWNPHFLLLLVVSILFNYACGYCIQSLEQQPGKASWVLGFSIAVNLCALFYYKYLFAIMGWLNQHGVQQGGDWGSIVLPLGISFFTFTQIGFLVDTKNGNAHERGFIEYLLFVTFFPHLIAGPILHHREVMPQFAKKETYSFDLDNFGTGIGIFIAGLAKKVLIADQLAPVANAAFAHPGNDHVFEAWTGLLCYSMQLYFDFSGYSEMALGLARMFNVRFPANFDSPYKSKNIIDFWQRWHISLTRYITLYLYNPVSLWIIRKRAAKGMALLKNEETTLEGFFIMLVVPTFYTMILAGIWHGSGLEFLVFGLLHGVYLCINHAWRMFGPKADKNPRSVFVTWISSAWKWVLTYSAVLLAQVFFRAASVSDGFAMLGSMVGLGTKTSPGSPLGPIESISEYYGRGVPHWDASGSHYTLMVLFIWIAILPNVLQLFGGPTASLTKIRSAKPVLSFQWSPNVFWGIGLGFVALAVLMLVTGTTEFLYFRF